MKQALENIYSQIGADAHSRSRFLEIIGSMLHKTKKVNLQLQKQLEGRLKKKNIYQACMQGLLKIKSNQSSIMQAMMDSGALEEAEIKKIEAKWNEVDNYLKLLQSELDKVDDLLILQQWLEIQQNQALIQCWEELQAGS